MGLKKRKQLNKQLYYRLQDFMRLNVPAGRYRHHLNRELDFALFFIEYQLEYRIADAILAIKSDKNT